MSTWSDQTKNGGRFGLDGSGGVAVWLDPKCMKIPFYKVMIESISSETEGMYTEYAMILDHLWRYIREVCEYT